ncbi:hypothetical protein T484DRAFT_1821754, partial [Baffinella frigidus]
RKLLGAGAHVRAHRKLLGAGAHVLIATPGRLLDLCEEKAANLSGVSFLVLDEADRMLDLAPTLVGVVGGHIQQVLDEADRMLDLGFEKDIRRIIAMQSKHAGTDGDRFEKDIRRIISMCAKQRQTLMFSATWPMSIQAIASEFLSNPARVTVGSEELSANHRVKQIVEGSEEISANHRVKQIVEVSPFRAAALKIVM